LYDSACPQSMNLPAYWTRQLAEMPN